MTVKTELLKRINIGPEARCDVIRHTDGRVDANLYPVFARTYWNTHSAMDLTERELREILEAVLEGKKTK